MLSLFLRGVLAVAIIAAGLMVGAQLRAAREQLATGQAASAGTPTPTTQPVTPAPKPTATPALKPSQATAPTPPTVRTVVPTPVITPFTGTMTLLRGTVSMGGSPVRGARVMVYPSDSFNHGPTPMPPESGMTTTDDRGIYQVALAPGTYRVGAFRDYGKGVTDFVDGFSWVTWYGDVFVIGLGKDLVVSGNSVVGDIAMLRSVKAAGRVVGRDGVGVPNAQLSLSRYVAGIQFPFGGGNTDATGRFSLSHVAMAATLNVQAAGRTDTAWTSIDLDLRTDRTDIVATIDRGNIVSGTLRDTAGRPLPLINFGVTSGDTVMSCASCNSRSDSAGHFSITLPSATLRFRNWAQPNERELLSKEYMIGGDVTLDPVLESR